MAELCSGWKTPMFGGFPTLPHCVDPNLGRAKAGVMGGWVHSLPLPYFCCHWQAWGGCLSSVPAGGGAAQLGYSTQAGEEASLPNLPKGVSRGCNAS